ncbi:MAG: L-2-amino-thiazoline-4-carboxylic acid hydrolase [Caldilineaceae bacterium]|nr:L-2-amino-thiazoline-4-carboxylic acid hydrolase [Caldilineaceae bacterium]MCB9137529.1 L-2-amino-thiazoline-4-carboxylic acid hydrolase [Caldilineaceae bacterium]
MNSDRTTPPSSPPPALPPDTLTQRIGVLARREVEARILAPVIDALGERFGREEVIEVVKQVIIDTAQAQGRDLAETMGDNGSIELLDSLQYWTRDDALHIDVLAQDEERLDFNVTRCRYAEMYRALGVPELGAVFSCNRDQALVQGFNAGAEFSRTQTIMDGASFCDFRYRFPAGSSADTPRGNEADP